MTDPLFLPIRINSLEVKNRIYMPAMHLNMAQDYQVTDPLVAFYAERAQGGAGMITVGYATVDETAGTTLNIGAHRDDLIPGLSRLSGAIKENGARCAVQLNHAGRYNLSILMDGRQPVAPSAVASRMTREEPRALSADEVEDIIAAFGAAAGRVRAAGFDGVEVLSGTGYLISQFLSPLTNHRTDAYGGSFDNRMRFGLAVAGAVREAVGADFPVIFRINGNEFMPGGLTSEDLRTYAVRLTGAGVDALCVNVGWHEARVPQIVSEVPRGVFGYLARRIRERVEVPVIASHRINDPELAREMISDGTCDLVAMGRSLIADPDLPEKARTGREREIVHCIACGQGCFDNIFKLKPVTCLCNPRAGHEAEGPVPPAGTPRKVMVIGGGPAGMSAAVAAADRGHAVTLYEKSPRLGGQLHLAAAPPGRGEFAGLADDLAAQMAARSVKTVLNTAVDRAAIEPEAPDVVVLATGAVPMAPEIPGADRPNVVQAWDVLDGRVRVGSRVVVIGGGAVGVETALYLAEKGTLSGEAIRFLLVNRAEDPEVLYEMATRGTKSVTLVEMTDRVGRDIGKTTRWGMLQHAARDGVRTLTGTTALEITETGLRVETADGTEELPADTVVLGVGAVSHNPLEETVRSLGIPCRVVGDAHRVGKAFDAVHDGDAAGRGI